MSPVDDPIANKSESNGELAMLHGVKLSPAISPNNVVLTLLSSKSTKISSPASVAIINTSLKCGLTHIAFIAVLNVFWAIYVHLKPSRSNIRTLPAASPTISRKPTKAMEKHSAIRPSSTILGFFYTFYNSISLKSNISTELPTETAHMSLS